MLQSSEEPSDSLVFFRNAEFEKFAALLQDLYFFEVAGKVDKDSEAVSLGSEELKQVCEAHLPLSVEIRLKQDVRTETIFSNLLENQVVKLVCP